MKKTLIAAALITVVAFSVLGQWSRAQPLAEGIMSVLRDQGFSIPQSAGHHRDINLRTSMEQRRTLYAGVEYIIVGFGDADVTDIDLFLYNSSGGLELRDISVGPSPMLRFTVNRTMEYRIRVRLWDGRAPWSTVGYIIGYK